MCYLTVSLVCQTRNIECKAKQSFLTNLNSAINLSLTVPRKKKTIKNPLPLEKNLGFITGFWHWRAFLCLTHFLYYFLCTLVKFLPHVFFGGIFFIDFFSFPVTDTGAALCWSHVPGCFPPNRSGGWTQSQL